MWVLLFHSWSLFLVNWRFSISRPFFPFFMPFMFPLGARVDKGKIVFAPPSLFPLIFAQAFQLPSCSLFFLLAPLRSRVRFERGKQANQYQRGLVSPRFLVHIDATFAGVLGIFPIICLSTLLSFLSRSCRSDASTRFTRKTPVSFSPSSLSPPITGLSTPHRGALSFSPPPALTLFSLTAVKRTAYIPVALHVHVSQNSTFPLFGLRVPPAPFSFFHSFLFDPIRRLP